MRARRRCASFRDRAAEGAPAPACPRQSGTCGRPSLVSVRWDRLRRRLCQRGLPDHEAWSTPSRPCGGRRAQFTQSSSLRASRVGGGLAGCSCCTSVGGCIAANIFLAVSSVLMSAIRRNGFWHFPRPRSRRIGRGQAARGGAAGLPADTPTRAGLCRQPGIATGGRSDDGLGAGFACQRRGRGSRSGR